MPTRDRAESLLIDEQRQQLVRLGAIDQRSAPDDPAGDAAPFVAAGGRMLEKMNQAPEEPCVVRRGIPLLAVTSLDAKGVGSECGIERRSQSSVSQIARGERVERRQQFGERLHTRRRAHAATGQRANEEPGAAASIDPTRAWSGAG